MEPQQIQPMQALELTESKLALKPYLKEVTKNLLPQEAKIVQLKYAAKRFGKMDEEELGLASISLLAKISIITGWTIPINPALMMQLDEQFAKKLQERYADVNSEEVEYAFRNKGIEIKDWGKALNLALIDEVMIPYLHNRFDISRQEDKLSSQISMIEEKKPLSDEEWAEWIPDIRHYHWESIPNILYEYLERKEIIKYTSAEKHEFIDRAIGYFVAILEGPEQDRFLVMKKNKLFDKEYHAKIKTIAKKLAVKKYFDETDPDNTTSTLQDLPTSEGAAGFLLPQERPDRESFE